MFGHWEILLVILVLVLLFGAGRIPRLMGDMAKGIKAFKSGLQDDEQSEAGKAAPDSVEPGEDSKSSNG